MTQPSEDSFWKGPLAPKEPVVVTSLPRPLCHVGFAFLAYGENAESTPCFCECTRRAINNYIISRLSEKQVRQRLGQPFPQGRYGFVIDGFFPQAVGEYLWKLSIKNEDVLKNLLFQPGVCHKCNRAVPPYENIEAPSFFEKVFRKILYRDLYDMGFDFVGHPLPHLTTEFHESLLPNNFAEIMAECNKLTGLYYSSPAPALNAPPGTWSERQSLHQAVNRIHRQVEGIHKKVRLFAADNLRSYYDFPKFKKWLQRETVLFLNLRSIFRGQDVIRHAKPNFLGGLELDVWIPEQRLGIEFQGAQHLKPFDYLGGDDAFIKTQERDARKKKLCEQNGVKLLCFFETDDLNESSILRLLGIR